MTKEEEEEYAIGGMDLGGGIYALSAPQIPKLPDGWTTVGAGRPNMKGQTKFNAGQCAHPMTCTDQNCKKKKDKAPTNQPEVMAVEQGKLRIICTADSGAVDTVGPEHVARHIATLPNDAPRAGMHFVAANGTPIYNMGEKHRQS